ncbi:MAG: D-2-hydroxyacid dehydrogenase, partial [Acidobacteria bacterium]|nr:D-2-hydroxyacid dehydrogenase [Acidobacteriota bacterium]
VLFYTPSPSHWERLHAVAPGATLEVIGNEEQAREAVRDAEAILGNRYFLQSVSYARKLRWFQSNSVGMDLIGEAGPLLQNFIVTNARSVYDEEIADHAVALLLALCRQLHASRDAQQRRQWEQRSLKTLSGSCALIVGWGGVGKAVCKRLTAFGVTVQGVRRGDDRSPEETSGMEILTVENWRDSLPSADFLILALPFTPETQGMVGVRELSLLKPGALLVNVGRGETLDEGALLEALAGGRVGGAGLDVFRQEPLPPEHPFWRDERILITPHVARSRESPPFRWEPLFEENLRRFAGGEPLLNRVDFSKGY